jgi:hypothetical protein
MMDSNHYLPGVASFRDLIVLSWISILISPLEACKRTLSASSVTKPESQAVNGLSPFVITGVQVPIRGKRHVAYLLLSFHSALPFPSRRNFGVTIAGEFAGSPNDCGLYVRGVGENATSPQCPEYDPWESYNSTMKAGVQNFIMSQFDALGDWFFWTWKVCLTIYLSPFHRSQIPFWETCRLLLHRLDE